MEYAIANEGVQRFREVEEGVAKTVKVRIACDKHRNGGSIN